MSLYKFSSHEIAFLSRSPMAPVWEGNSAFAIDSSTLKPAFKAHPITSRENSIAMVFSVFEFALVQGTVGKLRNTMSVTKPILKLSSIFRSVDQGKFTNSVLSAIVIPFPIVCVSDRVPEFMSSYRLGAGRRHFKEFLTLIITKEWFETPERKIKTDVPSTFGTLVMEKSAEKSK